MGWLVDGGDRRIWVSSFGSWVSSMREREREREIIRFVIFSFFIFLIGCIVN